MSGGAGLHFATLLGPDTYESENQKPKAQIDLEKVKRHKKVHF
jgi:hypothetical protein